MVSVKTKSAVIGDIAALLSAVTDKFEADEDGDAERDFMVQHCPARLEATIRTLPTRSMHLLAHVADGPISVVGLAARAAELKGTVSKHVQRLVDVGLVVRAPIPGNRKETELRLTDDGELVVTAHRRLHDEMDAGLKDFLAHYTQAELHVLTTVLHDLMRARKVGVRLQRGD